jgi:peptidoglycan/LPS O-acetylase OafA/YrhL
METSQRQTYLDWLRIISIVGVLFFHSAMPYTAEYGWHIKNRETSNLFMEFAFFMHLWRMPLLFFISGTVSYYMMKNRSTWNFVGLRFRRLFIPLVFGMLVVVPPQIYLERLNHGYTGTFWDFYKTVYNFVPYPKGSFSWHHLWFIAYLFLYDLLFAPLFAWLASPKSLAFKESLKVLTRGKLVYLIAIPSIIWYALLTLNHPETNDLAHDWCFFVYWLLFVLAGFICILQPEIMNSLERNRSFALTVAFLGFLLIDYLRWNKFEPLDRTDVHGFWLIASNALRPITTWGWVFALVGYGKHYLNKKAAALNYLNQAVYPFYIIHQTIIVALAYFVVDVQHESILGKYVFTVGATFFVTMGIYHTIVRPYPVMRFLFGMKPLAEDKSIKKLEPENEAILLSA